MSAKYGFVGSLRNPLLCTLEDRLLGVTIGRRRQRFSLQANAEDIKIFLTNRENIATVNQAIKT
jgi:hypothetical protein